MALTTNINTTGAPNLTLITAADSTTDWAAFGGGASGLVQETDFVIEGTNSVSKKITGAATLKGHWYDWVGAGNTALDFSIGGAQEGDHIFMWLYCTTPTLIDTFQNGGMRIRLGSSTTNWNEWYVAGSDTYAEGGWFKAVIDPRLPASNSNGTFDLSAVSHFGASLLTTGTVKAENLAIDAIHYGTGYQVEGTSTTDDGFGDIIANDIDGSQYGLARQDNGIIFIRGRIQIGDNTDGSGVATTFTDKNKVIVFEEPTYHDGTNELLAVHEDLIGIDIAGNDNAITSVTMGTKVGSGDTAVGADGILFQSAGSQLRTNFNASKLYPNDTDVFKIYGCTFQGLKGGIILASDTNHEFIGNTVTGCGKFDPRGKAVIRNCTFSGTDNNDIPARWIFRDDNGAETGFSTEAQQGTIDDVIMFPTTEVATQDSFMIGHWEPFDEIVFNLSTAGVGGTVTWQYYDGTSWQSLTGGNTGTYELTASGETRLTYTFPTDWNVINLNVPNNADAKLQFTVITEDISGSFADETDDAFSTATGDVTVFPATVATDDAIYFGHDFPVREIRIDVGTAGAGTYTLAWEYSTGDGTWGDLEAVPGWVNASNDLKNSGIFVHTWNWPEPTDWKKDTVWNGYYKYWIRARYVSGTMTTNPILDEVSATTFRGYFIRANVATTYSTNPLASKVLIKPMQAAIIWDDFIDIKNCSFNANTDASLNVSAIQHNNNAGVVDTYDNLTFSGNDSDILNVDDGESNTFTTDFATDDKLDVTAHPYAVDDRVSLASTGTLPAGLLADTAYYIINTTANDFELSLSASPGSAVDITDNGSGTHTIRKCLAIDTTNGSDPGSERNTTDSDVVVANAVTLTVTVKDVNGNVIENAQTSIQLNSDKSFLMNADTNASGIATTSYNYGGDVAITVRVRKSSTGSTKYKSIATGGTITASGFDLAVTMIVDTIADPSI